MIRTVFVLSFVVATTLSSTEASAQASSRLRSANGNPNTATFFVAAQSGNDAWSGTLAEPNSSHTDGPFRTIEQAERAARNSTAVKVVTLRTGTYPVAAGLAFTHADSGQSWLVAKGERAVIDGQGTGSVSINQADHLTIEGLTFENLAAGTNQNTQFSGLIVRGSDETIRWNTFRHCRYNCLLAGHIENSIIDSNVFSDQSPGNNAQNEELNYDAIKLWNGPKNVRVTHNRFENLEGGGVVIASGPNPPPSNDNLIDRNIFSGVAQHVHDAGAIYIVDRTHAATGNRITNNLILNVGGIGSSTSWTKAIYLDDLASNTLVSGNICRGCGEFAFQIHGGDHNSIVNNIFDLTGGALLGEYDASKSAGTFTGLDMQANTIERNIVFSTSTFPQPLWKLPGIRQTPSMNLPSVTNNLYYSGSGGEGAGGGMIVDAHPVFADPGFRDSSSGNFDMPESSAAFRIGFQPLPHDQGPLPSPFSP